MMKANNLYDQLKMEHQETLDLLGKAQSGGVNAAGLIEKARSALNVHMLGEENLFYPELLKGQEDKQMSFEAYEEHGKAKESLNELVGMGSTDQTLPAKVKVLSEQLQHHIEEEEKQIFPEAQKVLSESAEKEIMSKYLVIKQNAI
jgi:iron-sulfur cluster repair protein YtfE (RIC family)